MTTGYQFINTTQSVPSSLAEFTVTTPPSTDIWARPTTPVTERFDGPILFKRIPLPAFRKARVTVSADWKQQYDQGGLIVVVTDPKKDSTPRQWVKTGIEFYEGQANVSTVARDRWADWSLLPLAAGSEAATIEMAREDGGLWVYLVEGEKRTPIREVTWLFENEQDKEAWVGVYTAKPSTEGGELIVHFAHLDVETL